MYNKTKHSTKVCSVSLKICEPRHTFFVLQAEEIIPLPDLPRDKNNQIIIIYHIDMID